MLNTTFFDSLSEGVKKEIRLWSKTALEVPEENLNNLAYDRDWETTQAVQTLEDAHLNLRN